MHNYLLHLLLADAPMQYQKMLLHTRKYNLFTELDLIAHKFRRPRHDAVDDIVERLLLRRQNPGAGLRGQQVRHDFHHHVISLQRSLGLGMKESWNT